LTMKIQCLRAAIMRGGYICAPGGALAGLAGRLAGSLPFRHGSCCSVSELKLPDSLVENVVAAIDVHYSGLELALPPGLGPGHLLKLRQHQVARVLEFIIL